MVLAGINNLFQIILSKYNLSYICDIKKIQIFGLHQVWTSTATLAVRMLCSPSLLDLWLTFIFIILLLYFFLPKTEKMFVVVTLCLLYVDNN